ncbi:hypothetical protein HKD37_U059153 [Glycine soja]
MLTSARAPAVVGLVEIWVLWAHFHRDKMVDGATPRPITCEPASSLDPSNDPFMARTLPNDLP